jgi:hypothetical protein
MLEPELSAKSTEASGVRVPPPLYYVAGFLIGAGLEAAFPIGRPPVAITLVGTALNALRPSDGPVTGRCRSWRRRLASVTDGLPEPCFAGPRRRAAKAHALPCCGRRASVLDAAFAKPPLSSLSGAPR